MGLFTKNPNETAYTGGKKHWADVIKNGDRTGEKLIWRMDEEDFNTDSTLTVMPGEEAIFIKDGVIEQVFENGKYQLSTNNYPVISRLRNAFTGGISTFNCVVYFVKKAHSKEILWGTTSPLQVEDPNYGEYVKIKAHGACKIQIDNSAIFLEKMAGNVDGIVQDEFIVKYFSNEMQQYIRSTFKRAIKGSGTDVVGVIGEPDILAQNIHPFIQNIFDDYGVQLKVFSIGGVFVEENDPGFISIMEMKRDENRMNRFGVDYRTHKGLDMLDNISTNPGSGGVAAAGAGLGMGMAAGSVFGSMAQQVFAPAQQTSGTNVEVTAAKENPVEKIKQLKEMLDLEIISQEEFNMKKQEILNRM